MSKLVIRGTFIIETQDGLLVHPKVIELLREIDKTGSLNSAVTSIAMSYSYAWNIIQKTNCQLNTPLVITRRGGGIAKLTPEGKKLLNYCNKVEKDLIKFVGVHSLQLKA